MSPHTSIMNICHKLNKIITLVDSKNIDISWEWTFGSNYEKEIIQVHIFRTVKQYQIYEFPNFKIKKGFSSDT